VKKRRLDVLEDTLSFGMKNEFGIGFAHVPEKVPADAITTPDGLPAMDVGRGREAPFSFGATDEFSATKRRECTPRCHDYCPRSALLGLNHGTN